MKTRALLATALLASSTFAADPAPKGEDVSFQTSDGLTIAATYWPAATTSREPSPVVIALPMYAHDRTTYAPMVAPLTERGMSLLALDLRGHGGSAMQGKDDLGVRVKARDPALFNAMHEDVAAAVAWLAREKKTPRGKIGLLGASVGCSVAIDAATRTPDEFAAVVCLSPGTNYLGVPTLEHVAKWPKGKPLLLVASPKEATTGAVPIQAAIADKRVEVRTVEGGADADASMALHGTNMFGRAPDVERNVAEWLAYRLAFRRIDLGGGATAVIGATGDELYVGVETSPDAKAPLDGLLLRVRRFPTIAPVTEPLIHLGPRLSDADSMGRRRARIPRSTLAVDVGEEFRVEISLDGRNFLPNGDAPPLSFALR